MKLVIRLILGLAAVLVLVAAAFAFRLERSVPPLSGTEALPGLGAAVEVAFDSLAIPHITAQSDRDAFRALGYLHARDRLWQMETLRRAAEGRLSEIVGPAALASDRYLRALDIPRVADASLALLPPESRAILDAYVAGVNQWIAHPARPLPPEFVVLRFRPEPWTARHSLEVSRIMAWDLANASVELSLARAAAQVGPERIRELFPWVPDTGATILRCAVRGVRCAERQAAHPTHRAPRTAHRPFVPSVLLAARDVPAIPRLAQEVLEAASISHASNSWVIGGSRTASGKPILANDPHLFLRAPSIWYLATIESPHFTVTGVTIAGLPPVVIGHNRRMAWGLTNMEADDADYVIERLSPDSARVQTPAGWAAVAVVRDSIRIKGRPAVPFTLRRTPNGPVADAPAPGPSQDSGGTVRVLALKWNGHTPSDDFTALLNVDRAGTWDEFLAAVSGFKAPEQNWIFADTAGNIGYTASGNIPVRHAGVGLLPTPGWTGEGRWERFLRFAELPRVFNPAEGFIVTANNRIIGPEYPFHLQSSPALPYRAARIREMILAGTRLSQVASATGDDRAAPWHRFSAADVRRMQLDTVDGFARWAKALAAGAARGAGRADLAAALTAWDGTMGADRTEPTLFWLWYRALQRLTYEDQVSGYAPNSPLHGWLARGGSDWFDDTRTPEREDLAALSLRAMRVALADSVVNRRWGAVHGTVSAHALGSAAPLQRLLHLTIGPRPRAGSLYTVNVADFGSRAPFTNDHAASWRQVVDLADIDRAGMILTTGESGNPRSAHYRDQADRWWRGELWTVPLSRNAVRPVGVLRLTPRP